MNSALERARDPVALSSAMRPFRDETVVTPIAFVADLGNWTEHSSGADLRGDERCGRFIRLVAPRANSHQGGKNRDQ